MPENEFEKQVKELMEELHFSPSAPVWEKIKKRINEKKRRMWPIFFLLLSLAVVSSYFFYTDIKHADKNITKNRTIIKTPVTKSLPGDENSKKINKKDSAFVTQLQQSPVLKKIDKSKNVHTVQNSRNNKPVFNHPLIKKNNVKEIIDTSADKKSYANTQAIQQDNNINNKVNKDNINNNNINDNINTQIQKQPELNNISGDSITDNINGNADSLVKANPEIESNNGIAQKKNQTKIIKKSKWQWGISAMYGRSTITDKFPSGGNEKSLTPNSANPGAPYGYPAIVKNPYNPNTAYSFGVAVQRKILKQSSLNTGINFVHLSAKSHTALRLDSTLALLADVQNSNLSSGFYRAGSAKTYTSNFSFIEIPVTFQSRIFHVNNFSLLYDAGASVRQLISSNALVYDNRNNSFSINDDLFRRTQVQLKAGLNFQLEIKNSSILLGPNFSYSLTPYLKDNNYGHLHFANYGLHASWLFNKK